LSSYDDMVGYDYNWLVMIILLGCILLN